MEVWNDFFIATAGAAGALTGLVIVAVSVNVAQILKYPQLPARASATIASLVLALLVALAGLAPQPRPAFGIETALLGFAVWALHTHSGSVSLQVNRAQSRPREEAVRVILLGQAQTVPVVIAGVLIAFGLAGGSYVLLAGLLALFALTMVDAWVLLVEILR